MKYLRLIIALFILFGVGSKITFAQTPSVVVSLPIMMTPSPTPVDYTLPYPGILPDNPLYFLKSLRDNIYSLMISDPLKKTEFDLLMANKRLQMGVFLLQESKSNAVLALSTISKGENYMTDALSKVQSAKSQGENTNDVIKSLNLATRKHEEVLHSLDHTIPLSQQQELKTLEQNVSQLIRQASSLTK